MPLQISSIVLALAILLAVLALGRLLGAWWKFRGPRVITCPENRRPAGVSLDARHAALSSLGRAPEFRLSSCSRWPERAGCGQNCLAQIEAAPQDCLVRTILIRWYAGKRCASCGRPFGDLEWAGAKPAVLCADRISRDWSEIPAEQLEETLSSALPVCFACHMAGKLVREHPDLVTDRSVRLPTPESPIHS